MTAAGGRFPSLWAGEKGPLFVRARLQFILLAPSVEWSLKGLRHKGSPQPHCHFAARRGGPVPPPLGGRGGTCPDLVGSPDITAHFTLVCHPDRSGRFFPPLTNVSAGRAVEGSWLNLSTGKVAGNICPLPRISSQARRGGGTCCFFAPVSLPLAVILNPSDAVAFTTAPARSLPHRPAGPSPPI